MPLNTKIGISETTHFLKKHISALKKHDVFINSSHNPDKVLSGEKSCTIFIVLGDYLAYPDRLGVLTGIENFKLPVIGMTALNILDYTLYVKNENEYVYVLDATLNADYIRV